MPDFDAVYMDRCELGGAKYQDLDWSGSPVALQCWLPQWNPNPHTPQEEWSAVHVGTYLDIVLDRTLRAGAALPSELTITLTVLNEYGQPVPMLRAKFLRRTLERINPQARSYQLDVVKIADVWDETP